MTIWEIRKYKNENKKTTEEAKNKDARELLLKEKLFKDISRYGGLWLSLDLVNKKLSQLICDNEKQIALSITFQNTDKKNFQFSEKVRATLKGQRV